MTDQPDSVERLISILESWCERSETHHEQCGCQMARRFREAFAAERERYAKLEAENDKLTEMYERALGHRRSLICPLLSVGGCD